MKHININFDFMKWHKKAIYFSLFSLLICIISIFAKGLNYGVDFNGGTIIEISFENISSYAYPGARPLFFYIKKAHVGVIPGIAEFLAEFTSEKAWGDEGYLTEKGMIPLNAAKRKELGANVRALKPM